MQNKNSIMNFFLNQNNLDPLERKKRKKSEFGSTYISEADMPKDEKFVSAQAKLKGRFIY